MVSNRSVTTRLVFAVLVVGVQSLGWTADSASSGAGLKKSQATCESLRAWPESIELPFLTDTQAVILQAFFSDGSTLDVSEQVKWDVEDPTVASVVAGQVKPLKSGQTTATVSWEGHTCEIEIAVAEDAAVRPVRFRNDILPVLTRSGCNSGKCHGAASGKDGFGLSLYGFNPEGDYYRITRELSGRRINLADPEACLLVNKATGEVPHTGGMLIEVGSPAYRKLLTWLALGAEEDPAGTPSPLAIEVYPNKSVMSRPGLSQQIRVFAKYDDGSSRDVTDLAVFFSNNDAAVTVTEDGLSEGTGQGTAFIMARFDQFTAGTSMVVRPGSEYVAPDYECHNYIDEYALSRWKDLHIKPSELATDAAFLRRVYLDTIGLLPTPDEVRGFVADAAPDKRSRAIDALLARDEFLDMWIMKLAELLQIRRANGLSQKGLLGYDAWLRDKVHSGATVDQIVRELIPASGSTFENPPTSYYQTETTPQLIAENIAQAFLGMRIQCAQCHNHPFDRWTMDDYYGFASFVSQVGYKQAKDPREITVYNSGEGNLAHPVAGREVRPKYLGGEIAELNGDEDYREVLAAWLTSPENHAFANNLSNVLWEQFFGRGIVAPVDDVRVSNPASNPELMQRLGQQLVAYKFDIRKLASDMLNSRTYQLSTQANEWNAWDDKDFSHARIRRLRAEVLLDCISQVTETSDRLSGLPLGGRAIEIPDGASNSYFLETFGRATRRTPCSCEVSTSPTLSQALHLLNGETTSGKIEEGGVIDKNLSEGKSPMQIVDTLYLTCYARTPTTAERNAIQSTLSQSKDARQDLVDLFWALLNSNEFIFNH
jgi:hypothetical protein